MKTIEHFGGYIEELTVKLNHIRTSQDDEKRSLIEIRNCLKNSPGFNKMVSDASDIFNQSVSPVTKVLISKVYNPMILQLGKRLK